MNPYQVLGVNENATDAEIKAAYREAVKKYHPDQYQNSPLADVAEEKLKQINVAYDTIQKQRSESSRFRDAQYSAANDTENGSQDGDRSYDFSEIRNRISMGDLDGAEALLNRKTVRNSQWNYLMGVVCERRGWHNEANTYYQRAYNMNPSNPEYARAARSNPRKADFYSERASRNDGACSTCFTSLCLADCCCECFGGDLIPCC